MDVGNGVQLVDVGKSIGNPVEDATKLYSLVDLKNRIEQAPIEQLLKKTDALLKQNQLDQIPVENAIRATQLYHAQNEDFRQQAEFQRNNLRDLHQAFAQNFDLGVAAMQTAFPNARAVKNEDGTVAILIGNKAMTIDPMNVADPEKKQRIAEGYRKEWVNAGAEYATKSQAFNNIKKTYNLATGAGDVATLYNWIKIIEPGIAGAVREGEIALGQATSSYGQQILNLYNKAVQTNAPIFGEANSAQRRNFFQTAQLNYNTVRQAAIDRGRFFGELAGNEKIDPRKILQPVGDLKFDDFFAKQAETPPARSTQGAAPAREATPAPALTPQPAPPPRVDLRNNTTTFLQMLRKNANAR